MEKKNINIGVVRTCTILLLTVFTIGRKYGQDPNAENLINNLKQQPCACCLNFGNVSEVAKVIDRAKNQLQNDKNQLQQDKNQLQQDKNQLQQDKEELKVQKREIQVRLEEKNLQLEEEKKKNNNEKIQLQNENKELQNQIFNLQHVDNENAGAAQVAKVVNENLSKYIEDLNKTNVSIMQLENEKQKIFEEKSNLVKELHENKQKLQDKDNELEETKKEIEDLNKTKEEIENELKTKNKSIKKYEEDNKQLIEEKAKLENELRELGKEYNKNYESTVEKNNKTVGENTKAVKENNEEISKINDFLQTWNKKNEELTVKIDEKTTKINSLNNQIEKNNFLIEKLDKEKNELYTKYNNLNRDYENLEQKYKEIKQTKEELEDSFKVCKGQMEYLTTQTNTLNDILKNTKTNVNMEEYANLYNSINAQKKTNISILLNKDVKTFQPKQYPFYIPFKFKDFKTYGRSSLKKTISDVFTKSSGVYGFELSLYEILRSFFEIQAFKKFKEWKIIKVTNLKEIYFDAIFQYKGDKIKIGEKGETVEETRKKAIELPEIVTSPKTQGNGYFKNEVTNYNDIAEGKAYKTYMNKFFLDYSNLIELVGIDEYLNKKGEGKIEDEKNKIGDKEVLFLLELDFKDPECIALLESVGKGNYGVVKKGLTFENGKLVTKAIKFTCSNDLFENSKEENILKEIRAGKIINEIGLGNKIAFVKDYMKIKNFKKRYEYKKKEKEIKENEKEIVPLIKKKEKEIKENEKEIVPLEKETENGDLTNAVYTTLLNDDLQTLPSGKTNVKADFENNVFNMNGKIGEYLYIMFMDIVNGKDLFLSKKKKGLDINNLGDMLFDVLKNLYVCGVALKDIKPKNIMWDEKKKFSIIDVQTLGMKGSNLADSCGTPELWPFFKTLNLNLESKNEKKNNEIKDNDGKDNLYDLFCNSIDDNFVDIYAACMTMYFAKFSTYTAAGLLTLLLKWLVLDEDNKGKKGWKTVSLNDKIKFLQEYKDKYEKYINFVNRKENNETINENLKNDKNKNNINEISIKEDECSNIIKFFFEKIDDKNLNDDQKKVLADLLKQVINPEKESNIFYLLNEIKDEIKRSKDMKINENENKNKNININENKNKNIDINGNEYPQIINFYKDCVKKDLGNFNSLYKGNCKYADVIKYVLCYGSCLNYNGENKEMDVNSILKKLQLKQDIEIQDKEFFDSTNNNVINDVIGKLKNGFNQTFIIDLLNILSLEKYNEILEHDVNKGSVDYHFKREIDSLKENEKDKKELIEKQKKVFYLLRYLEINKLFHIPKNILKINSLINKNTKNQLDGKKDKNKK